MCDARYESDSLGTVRFGMLQDRVGAKGTTSTLPQKATFVRDAEEKPCCTAWRYRTKDASAGSVED